jgi:hypothetical protein
VADVYQPWMFAMDAAYLREQAAICLRLASGLSWNNPARSQFLELAAEFDRRARGNDMRTPAEPALPNSTKRLSRP